MIMNKHFSALVTIERFFSKRICFIQLRCCYRNMSNFIADFFPVLLGSFRAYAAAMYILGAPDVQGDLSKSKPVLLRSGRGLG